VTGVNPWYGWAAGAIVSTADDITSFYRALLRGRLLPPDLMRAMETTVGAPSLGPAVRYGLGIAKVQTPCGASWGNRGGLPGYGTTTLSSKDGRRQIVVLATRDETLPERAGRAYERVLAAAYCG
jgi:D-alanyl-D-alanine carboxypeptidase